MSVKTWFIAKGITYGLRQVDKQGFVKDLARKIDKALDEELGSHSEDSQVALVNYILLPLIEELLSDNKDTVLQQLINNRRK